ncbi:MAG: carboxypeptidase regulatory-like domain-containing protein, partial [Acidobacteriota bacterium]|nr:carboxypeptidase regulatory-like domain-containing protein [Acidobacteriota bacterium]
AVVPGASVTLTSEATNQARTTVSNEEGFYRFDAVELGTYAVQIIATNFGPVTKNGITVNANQTSSVDTQLTPGGQQITIDVVSEAGAALQTEAPVRGGNISERQVTELPFAGRNPVSLALTLPGVSTNRGGAGVDTFSVNGARGRSNNFLIDGTENNDISVAGQGFQITNPDAVQEVSIQTSNYDAEFGRAGGAVINTITKGGTNEFHGTLSTLYDTRSDDAITSSESRDEEIVRRGEPPSGTENIFSGTIGGPVYLPRFGEGGPAVYNGRDRTFFFGAYQEDRRRSTGQVQLVTPTAAGRARLRSLFPEGANANVDFYLNATQSSVGTAGPQDFALGALTGGPDRGSIQFGTFFKNFASTFTDRQWQARIDHKLSDNDQLSGRFLSDRQSEPKGGIAGALEGFEADFAAKYYNFLVAETHVFSPSLTNEARIAYNRIQFGFPLTDPTGPAGRLTQIVFSASPLTSLGASSGVPQGRTANNYVIQDTMTYVRGDHTFRFGVDFLRQISTQTAPANPRGTLSYTATTGYSAFANYVDDFGGNGSATRDFGSPVYFPSLYRTAAFFQDRWKASEALTLTLGLRYEYFGTPFNKLRTPAFTGLFNVNPVTLTGPFSEPNQVEKDQNNFAPTLGIAYSPSFTDGFLGNLFGEKRTVLRAGYQIGYDSFFNNIASNAASSSPNLISSITNSAVSAANPRGSARLSSLFQTVAPPLSRLSAQTLIDPNLVNPYYQRWSIGVQRELPYNLIVDTSYVGSKGTRLYINEEGNPLVRPELRITPAGFTGTTTNRLDNLQGGRTVRTNGGSSIYHAGQLEVRRRFANNFTLTGAYTFSKSISNADDVFNSVGNGIANAAFFQTPAIFGGDRPDRGLSLFDRTHRASITYVYELPLFREQRGALGRLLGGFQLSGVTVFESGVPFTVSNGLDGDGIGGATNDRPNLNPSGQRGVRARPVVDTVSSSATFGKILRYENPDVIVGKTATGADIFATIDPNTAQFIVNPTYIAGNQFESGIARVGTLGRNTQRTPGINNFDFNILKRTRISETTSLEFRTEFYNIFNHPQYGTGSVSEFAPEGNPLNANFIPANGNGSGSGLFLQPNTSASDGGGRVIRYQLKFIF